VRCFKDLYYVGPLDLPAKHFCGAVDVNAMFRKGPFHGYNERSLSLPQAKDLHQSMSSGYKSISGLETIFFMAKQPLAAIASQLVPAWNAPVQTVADKLSLLQSFAALSFEEYTDVPQLFIPCCGEQKKKLNIQSHLYILIGKHSAYLFRSASQLCASTTLQGFGGQVLHSSFSQLHDWRV